jgi:signal transduction histidine kinase/ligand-binding sensor domain-containing protein
MRFFISTIFVCLLFVFSVAAEEIPGNRFLQTQWTTENGLPQNSVTSIAQTPDGYLWVGTFGGLARFDGVRFKIYTTSNTPELRSNRITALTTDSAGTLWIGTEEGELFKAENRVFSLFDDGKAFDKRGITDIFIDDKGVMLIGSVNARICTSRGCEKLETPDGVFKFRQDTNGAIWAKSNDKLYKVIDRKFIRDESFKEPVLDIEPCLNGGLWVSSKFDLSIYRDENRQIIKRFGGESNASVITELPTGELRFSRDRNLYSLSTDFSFKTEIEEVKEGGINRIFFDNQANLWLGWVSSGLVRLSDRRVQTLTFNKKFADNFFGTSSVNSIAEDFEGNVWVTTRELLFHRRKGETVQISDNKLNGRTIARGSLLVKSDGSLWQSSSMGLLSGEDRKIIVHNDISWTQSQSGNSLFEDSKGNLWYGYYGNGVIVSDGKTILAKYSTADGLAGNVVSIITETGDGAMWFGTTTGLSRLQNGEFTNFTAENGLSNEYVRDIYEDQDGTLWIGTYGGGLNRFRNGKFTPITTQNGLFDDIVSRILVDDDDNFWMLGNRGVYSVNRKMLNDFADGKINSIFCTVFTTADGMITSEGNGGYQNAGIRARDGKLWFPMINGIVIIDPKQEKLPPPKPLIEEVFLSGKLVDTSKKIEINPGNESLEINYTGFNFRKPEQIRFRYRLKGLDENWTDAGTRRMVNYPYLPSGNYRFQFSAANADGVWSNEVGELEIEVFPAFYRTWWFLILAWLLFFSILLAIYQYRSWYFEREKAKQAEFSRQLIKAQENERQRIASEIHDNLGQQLLVIKNWSSYCLQKPRKITDLRTPIEQINESAEAALTEVRAMAKNLSPYHLDKAGVSNTIRFMVKQVGESAEIYFETEIDNIDGILSPENEINLYRIVQESLNNILKHSHATEAKISIKRTENLIKLIVSDNGIGFYQTGDNDNFGFGLHGMAERAKMLKGTFTVKSNQNKGAEIIMEIKI